MRNEFPSLFPVKPDELTNAWNSSIFSFDANVLLNIYRVKPKTAEHFFSILERTSDRLWLSHQAAFEFLRNRESVIHDSRSAYAKARKTLTEIASDVRGKFRVASRHPFIDVEDIADSFRRQVEEYTAKLDALEEKHPKYLEADPHLDRIDGMFSNKVGQPFSDEELQRFHKEGETRFKNKIPPGYKDASKEGSDKYGDLIMWKQILSYFSNVQKPLVFVTDDEKEDWWNDVRGMKRGPRVELVTEFFANTKQPMLMYTMDRFLENAARIYGIDIKPENIEDAKEARVRPGLYITDAPFHSGSMASAVYRKLSLKRPPDSDASHGRGSFSHGRSKRKR
jgi:hypothetical protein